MTTTSDRIDSDSRASAPAGYRLVEISREPVALYKILNFEGLAEAAGLPKRRLPAAEWRYTARVDLKNDKRTLTEIPSRWAREKFPINS